jgi:hypothetical protein
MAVGYILDFEGGTAEQYDRVLERMQLAGHSPEGNLFHSAGPTDNGWRVFDAWESDEVFQRFAEEQIAPLSRDEGLPEPKVTRIEGHRLLDERDSGDVITFVQVVHLPGMDAATFDDADAEIRGGPGLPEGCVFHITGPGEGEWLVADGWTSKDVRDRFMQERVGPVMGTRGVTPPTIEDLPVHNTLSPV